MAKFSKGDKVESVKTGAKGVVDEVYGDEKYAVLFDGAASPDRVEGFQIKAANGCARNSAAARSANAVVQNAINARRARNAGGFDKAFVENKARSIYNDLDDLKDYLNRYAKDGVPAYMLSSVQDAMKAIGNI